jgi:hypothetical protein
MRRLDLRAMVMGVLAVLGLTACYEIFGPVWATKLGSIMIDSATSIVIPDSVAVSTDFTVSFQTGGGGCDRAGTTEVKVIDSRTVELRPYDEYQVNPPSCTANILFFRHTATLQFDHTGIATVRLIGAYNDTTKTITKTVVVR